MSWAWEVCCIFTYIDYRKYITNRMKIVPPPESLLGSLSGPYEMLILEAKVTGLAWGMWFRKHDQRPPGGSEVRQKMLQAGKAQYTEVRGWSRWGGGNQYFFFPTKSYFYMFLPPGSSSSLFQCPSLLLCLRLTVLSRPGLNCPAFHLPGDREAWRTSIAAGPLLLLMNIWFS